MQSTTKKFIQLGSIMMAVAVGLGAFGAHGLKDIVDAHMLEVWQKGVTYHFYHAIGLLFVAFLSTLDDIDIKKLTKAGYIMFFSIVLFSGSLYTMALTGITILGAITPIGGVGFIVSWLMIATLIKK